MGTVGNPASGSAVSHPIEVVKTPSSTAPRVSARASKLARSDFRWQGLALYLGRGKTPILTLAVDETHPHLYRIQYPDGWTSTPANLTRAKDAAYGHARWLLGKGIAS
jgi:hypothetical protein